MSARMPPSLTAALLAAAIAADGPTGRRQPKAKKHRVDKRKRAKRRQAKASRKRNRR